MKNILFNKDRRLRNGWWMLIFVAFIAATRFLYRPIMEGFRDLGAGEAWLEPVPFLFVLLATWACTRLRRERLSSVGSDLRTRWLREVVVGALIGTGAMLVIVGLIAAAGGVRLELNPTRAFGAATYGLYAFLFASLLEETLFRGFLFQRLVNGTSARVALISFALLFAFAHWGNPGMEGATLLWATLDTALGAVLLGLAYLRTRSLALPVGVHLGWNWAQGHLLGFGVSGYEQVGWFRPLFQGKAEWLTGGAFGPEASVFAVVVDLVVIALLWKWKGTSSEPSVAVESVPPPEFASTNSVI